MVTDLVSLVWHVCCVGHDSQEEDRSLQRQAGRHTATEPVLHNKILNRTSTPFRLGPPCLPPLEFPFLLVFIRHSQTQSIQNLSDSSKSPSRTVR